MLIALMSDTHDHVANTQAALTLLAAHKPVAYLHAGDLVSPQMLDLFKGLPFHFVFGNNEYDHATLRSRAHAYGLTCHGEFGELTFGGKKIALTHGHTPRLTRAVYAGTYQYVVHGHTHVRADKVEGGTRVINPGALQRAQAKSVALLDVVKDELQFLSLGST